MPGSAGPWQGQAAPGYDPTMTGATMTGATTTGAAMTGAAVLQRTALRYHGGGRFARHYVASKLRTDPVHRTVLAMAAQHPFGIVTDVGCGRGQLGVALLEAGGASSVLGLDWAGASLRDAARAGAGLAFTAQAQDLAADPTVPACDTVLLIDVLYILRQARALTLLAHAAAAARQLVLVRTLDPGLGLRSRFHVALERLGQPIWPHAGATVDPAPVAALIHVLEQAGFAVSVAPCWQGTPFANVLLTARRR